MKADRSLEIIDLQLVTKYLCNLVGFRESLIHHK